MKAILLLTAVFGIGEAAAPPVLPFQEDFEDSDFTPCCVGLNQVDVRVPGQAPAGDAVPLQVQLGGITTTDKATSAIARQ